MKGAVMAGLMLAGSVAVAAPTAATFLNETASARQSGMGGLALAGGDPLSGWINPAQLAAQQPRWAVALTGASRFGEQTTYGLGAATRLGDRWTAGVLVSGYTEILTEVNALGEEAGSLNRGTMGAGAAGAVKLGPAQAGLLVKLVRDDVLGDSASTVAVDAGATVSVAKIRAATISVGAAARNLGGKLRPATTGNPEGEALPAEFRGGALVAVGPVSVGGEFVGRPAGGDAAVGAEWRIVEAVAIRAGLDGLKAGQRSITAGFSAVFSGMGLDYAFATHELGAAHRVGLSYGFTPGPRKVRAPMPEGGLNVAVAALDAQGVSGTDAAVVADWMRNELVKSGVKVIERGQMERLLAEQALQQTGCTSADCAVKLGKLLNAQRMVVGSLGKILGSYVLSIRIIDVETSQQMGGDTARAADVRELETAIKDLAGRMSEQLR